MPVKYFGKPTNYCGKTLWEIVGNLRNFGVGRLIIKDHFKRYPEPSYYKIVKVQPVQTPSKEEHDRLVMVWAESVFRGKKVTEQVMMHSKTHMKKFQLVPKSEEYKYLEYNAPPRVSYVPEAHEWPPLFKALLEQEMTRDGNIGEIPVMKRCYNMSDDSVTVVDKSLPPRPDARPTLYMTSMSVKDMKQHLASLTAAKPEEAAKT